MHSAAKIRSRRFAHATEGVLAVVVLFAMLATLTLVSKLEGRSLLGSLLTTPSARNTSTQERTLSFADRVAYQRTVEEVYWRHRIWPEENGVSKPSFDELMPQAEIEKKVEQYLGDSEALKNYWGRALTPEQLQAEVDRMAKQTKRPDILHELFAALGNDPVVIAECLARPALSARLLANYYARDQRFHDKLKQRAEAELNAHHDLEQLRKISDGYAETEWVRREPEDVAPPKSPRGERPKSNSVALRNDEWNASVRKLAADFDVVAGLETAWKEIPIGKLSRLLEDDTRYYVTAVISKSNDRLKFMTIEWHKEPFASWRERAENLQVVRQPMVVTSRYTLPTLAEDTSACSDDTWTPTSNVPGSRAQHSAIWTGSEMIVWGGMNYDTPLNTGEKYNPATDTWSAITSVNAADARSGHTAVWTGNEMIVWGGYNGFLGGYLSSGGRYNPTTDTWTLTSTTRAPDARTFHTTIWTGTQMIVWGGIGNAGYLDTGGRYNPRADRWTPTSMINAPDPRFDHTSVWSGAEMIVWGGQNGNGYLNTGAKYDPRANSWAATTVANAPVARYGHTAVWTGGEMIVWGGWDGQALKTGERYDPTADSWTPIASANAPHSRFFHTAIWSGSEMIVWGGHGGAGDLNSGGRYNPVADSWTLTSKANAPQARENHTAIWTGSEMIVFGGGFGETLNTGGKYDPTTDSWMPVHTTDVPSGRYEHTSIWTGTEMIVWGGELGSTFATQTGGRYDPVLDSWTPTSTTNAPHERESHTAVWTGREMIVWGGWYSDGSSIFFLNTGGRYSPATDSWKATSTNSVPAAARYHTAVWTGTEMIVWGGEIGGFSNQGGRYNPRTNSWAATSLTNAPSAREFHTSVWTGSRMVVWGGYNGSYLNAGGSYNPTTDSWTATTQSNSPQGRSGHTAIWTGSAMIVWGGYSGSYLNTGGSYNPATDTWLSTSTANSPPGRSAHGAIWTGSEMIVWGGYNGSFLNTGGRYTPSTDTWAATSISNAPSPREFPAPVWTGNQMIIWGGYNGTFLLNTGARYCAQPADN